MRNDCWGQMLGGGLGDAFGGKRGKKRRGAWGGGLSTGAKAQLGVGLLGIAMAAWEHYSQKSAPAAGAPVQGIPPRPPGAWRHAATATAAVGGPAQHPPDATAR
ncbi:MAG: hypothetical protein LKM32_04635 [Chiayiivirga sp.]|jgi:hypothetical protein|uniref:hypothetical protein n=1 Tax=Chiayiivirga sp. TaxID=2041042 RepID=UPI0025C5E9A9|nr:hypothetical protein [Chiayiivirga sp.]MCI1728700.1 hypothetical protein [Chiayiivirga sp.]